MNVLINGSGLINKPTGVQYYIKNLVNELINQHSKTTFEIFLWGENKHITKHFNQEHVAIHNVKFFSNKLARIAVENTYLPFYFNKKQFNVFHGPAYVLPYFTPIPSVLTVHDLIAFEHPEFCQDQSVIYFNFFLPRSVKKATKIIAVSQTVKNTIIEKFKISGDKIDVIYLGVSEKFRNNLKEDYLQEVKNKYKLPSQFFLFVGNIEPKKNLDRLLEAFIKLKRNTDIPHKLVIVGKPGWKYKSFFNLLSKSNHSEDVVLTNYVCENDLPAIYNLCDVFVFPSLYEGFGIPALEAMACGKAVLISNKGALPEITGNNCLQVDPYSIDEIANGMYNLITDASLKNNLIEKSLKWVKDFTWENTAKRTLKVYEDVCR